MPVFEVSTEPPRPEEIFNPNGELIARRHDVTKELIAQFGPEWRSLLREGILADAHIQITDATDESCREDDPAQKFEFLITSGKNCVRRFPQLGILYSGVLLRMMQESVGPEEELRAYEKPEEGMHFAVQLPVAAGASSEGPLRRMDAHVDVRATLIFGLDVPDMYEGGDLVIANHPGARTVSEIDADCSIVPVIPGTVLCFPQGRELAHYPQVVRASEGLRIIASMDYLNQFQTPEALISIDKRIGNV